MRGFEKFCYQRLSEERRLLLSPHFVTINTVCEAPTATETNIGSITTSDDDDDYKNVDAASNKIRYCKECEYVERNLLEDDPSNKTTDCRYAAGNNTASLDALVVTLACADGKTGSCQL